MGTAPHHSALYLFVNRAARESVLMLTACHCWSLMAQWSSPQETVYSFWNSDSGLFLEDGKHCFNVLLGTVTLSCFQGQSRFLWLRCGSSNWDVSSSSEVDLRVELYSRKYLKQWGCSVTRQMLTGVPKLLITAWAFKMFPLIKVWCGLRTHFGMLETSLLGNPLYLFLISTPANVILTANVKNCSFS